MTLKVDGTNGVLQAYDYQVLTTGFSYTFASGTQTLIINPAGTLATGTITMPASPVDGMTITVVSTQQVTAVTVAANSGQTLVGGAAQLIPNQPLSFVYRLANTTWYPFAGGAGRATALVSGTAVASTSGTSIDFTGIPSWVKRITVNLSGVSISAGANLLIQLGTSGTPKVSGYLGAYLTNTSAPAVAVIAISSGFVFASTNASSLHNGTIVFSLLSAASNTWSGFGIDSESSGGRQTSVSGSVPLSGTLGMVRITTTSTDTFDAGSINILYE